MSPILEADQQYPAETIGSVMSADIPTCHPDDTLQQILHNLSRRSWRSVRNVYVVGPQHKLLGLIDIAALMQPDHTVIAKALMQPPAVLLHPEVDQEQAVFLAVKHDVVSIPVVDHANHLLGSVTAHSIIDIMHEEHIEDALLTVGIRKNRHAHVVKLATERTGLIVRARAPWLLLGLVAGLGLGFISSLFERQLQEQVAIAFFIPVVAYIADSVGAQTEVIAVRALSSMKLSYARYLAKELLVGLMLGLVLGTLGGLGAMLIAKSSAIGLVVGLSLFAASTVAALIASLVPMVLKSRGKDPALGAPPLATAVQDVVSILIYFTFAVLLL